MSDPVRPARAARVCGMAAALWVGSQLTIGYLAAPVLFATLDHAGAGSVASRLFSVETLLGCACAVVLILGTRTLEIAGETGWRSVRRLTLWMLVCVMLVGGLQSIMEPMRVNALLQGTDVGHTANAARFGIMHGVSSLIYLIESVLGLALLWRWPGR